MRVLAVAAALALSAPTAASVYSAQASAADASGFDALSAGGVADDFVATGARSLLRDRVRGLQSAPSGSYGGYGDAMAPTMAPPPGEAGFNFLGGKLQTPLPLPDGLTPRTIPEKGYIVEPLAEDVYFVTEGTYSTMFVVTSEGVVQVDSPASFGGRIAAAVAEVTDQPVKYLIYSHSHLDHVDVSAGGVDLETVTFVGTAAVKKQLEGAGDPRRPVPTEIVDDGATWSVGGVDFVLTSVKGAHDLGSTIVQLPARKIIMLVDLVAPGWAPFPFYAFTTNPQAHREALQTVLGLDFSTYVGGHFDTPATRADISRYLEYFNDSVRFMEEALAQPDAFTGAVASVQPPELLANRHLVFSQFQLRAVESCYERLIDKWGAVLGGVDVFGRSHCYIMWKFVFLDGSA